jgi:hypothetical protein
MKSLLSFILGLAIVVAGSSLTGCAVNKTRTAHYERIDATLGEDTYYEISAQNLTRTEPTLGTGGGVTVVMNPQKDKILAAFPNDPLAGIATATGLNIKVGKNQSKGLGMLKAMAQSALNWWGAGKQAAERTAQLASNNALKAEQARQATKQMETLAAPAKFFPGEGEALSRAMDAGAKPFIP